MAGKRSPFEVRLSAEKRLEWTRRLSEEIRTAKQSRSVVMDDNGLIDFAYSLYEQQAQKGISRDQPRYGTADLTSPIWTENVDALSARATHTMFRQEPFWIVEGIGAESAQKAPVVEQYMQFRQEQMRLQKTCKRAITAALIEPGSVLEVCEDTERCVSHQVVKADVQRSGIDGSTVLDAKTGLPLAARDEQGELAPAPDGAEAFVEVKEQYEDYRRRGAYVRRRSMKDFLFLPSHAEDERDVWGHAMRFWLPMDAIQRKVEAKEYDKAAAELLGQDTMERTQSTEATRQGTTVLYTPGTGHAEVELWQLQFWGDVDGKGLACYVAVVSEIHDAILSLRYDWLGRWRTVYVNPYPCPYSVYGYSLVLGKLLTIGEEHTAWRNMNADRATLKANAPLLRQKGSDWDPTVQPFAAGVVFDVANTQNEIVPMKFDDVTAQAMAKENQCPVDAQRVIGMNDIALGQTNTKDRTLGENQMATQQSFVRTDDPISNIEEALEEVGELVHAIEVQALSEMEYGLSAPMGVTQAVQYAGDPSFEGTFTKGMVDGQYRFKPRGSTDTADPQKRKQTMTEMLGQIFNLAKLNPAAAARVQSPEFADAVMKMLVDEYKPRDKGAFLAPTPQPMMASPAPAEAGGSFGAGAVLPQLMAGLPGGGQVQ